MTNRPEGVDEMYAQMRAQLMSEVMTQVNMQQAQAQQQAPAILPGPSLPVAFKPPAPEPFDGTKKTYAVEDFIFQIENYFTLTRVVYPADRIAYTATRLQGAALMWYRSTNPSHLPWDDFKKALTDEFMPINAVREARDHLARITQGDSVRTYLSRFRSLCMRVPNISEDEKLDRFLRGLDPELRMECELRSCTTVDEAARIAERVYATMKGVRPRQQSFKPTKTPYQPRYRDSGPQPMELGALPMELQVKAREAESKLSQGDRNRLKELQAGRTLTEEDRQFLRRVGACHCCRHLGHFKNGCPQNTRHPNGNRGPRR